MYYMEKQSSENLQTTWNITRNRQNLLYYHESRKTINILVLWIKYKVLKTSKTKLDKGTSMTVPPDYRQTFIIAERDIVYFDGCTPTQHNRSLFERLQAIHHILQYSWEPAGLPLWHTPKAVS